LTGASKTAAIALGALGILAALAGWAWLALAFGLGAGALLRKKDEDDEPAPKPATSESDPWQAVAVDSLLGSLQDGVVVLDAEGRALCANAPARTMLAMRGAAVSGVALSELVDWPQLEAAVFESRRSAASQSFEGLGPGEPQAQHLAVAVSAPDRHGIVVVAIRDHSRLRQLESLRRDFVANVSHELKTPLAAIQGFVETMIDDPEMPETTRIRFLERMQRQVQRLATLVTDLLTLSRLDEGAEAPSEPCDLAALLREVARDLAPFAEQRGVSLQVDAQREPVWVAAEREALRQVLGNLTDNAVKYTPLGGSVRATLTSDGKEAEFVVVDTGIGLAEEDQERVFERFYRVDKARSRELGGTGLGLSIVKNTVVGLGGSIGVRSRLGYGSTFWAKLPVVPADQEPASE
jgi:two-component system, OmpR family, phosphate regulon sensor histidine kinase PhoR